MIESQNFIRLAAISGMIAEGVPLLEVFHRIVDSVRLLGYDRVQLVMLSEDGSSLNPVAAYGFGEEGLGPQVQADQDIDLRQLRSDPRPQILSYEFHNLGGTIYERGCVPVLLKREVVGKFLVDNIPSGRPLEREQLQEVLSFAHQAALAYAYLSGYGPLTACERGKGQAGSMLSEEAELSAESLETLRETTLAITSMRGRDELLKIIVEQSVKLLRAKSGGLYEYRHEQEDLKLLAEYNRPENVGEILKLGEGIAGRLIGTGNTHMVITDYHKWEGQASIYTGRRIFGTVLAVPLRWEQSEIGVLYVDDEVERHFSEVEIRLLRLFAD